MKRLMDERTVSLWITDGPEEPPHAGVEVVRVTTLPGRPGTIDPRRPQALRGVASEFLDAHEGGAIVVDCVGPFAAHSGVERVMRALDDLHEEVATRHAILAVFLDPRDVSPRMVAWLEREFDALPELVSAGPLADRLAV